MASPLENGGDWSCPEKAIAMKKLTLITDSLSLANQAVSIKRVSNKNRNPKNKADKMEEFLIKGFGNDLNEKRN